MVETYLHFKSCLKHNIENRAPLGCLSSEFRVESPHWEVRNLFSDQFSFSSNPVSSYISLVMCICIVLYFCLESTIRNVTAVQTIHRALDRMPPIHYMYEHRCRILTQFVIIIIAWTLLISISIYRNLSRTESIVVSHQALSRTEFSKKVVTRRFIINYCVFILAYVPTVVVS